MHRCPVGKQKNKQTKKNQKTITNPNKNKKYKKNLKKLTNKTKQKT